jgi:LmbE family N-acetylglucosaminyl deacetylase
MKFNTRYFTLILVAVSTVSNIFAQRQTVSSSEILLQLQALNNVGKVLYIAAHPDDENTRLIAHLTNDLKVDVSYLSITRGDGGQNLIGTEIGDGLGLLRTHELLSARRIDGGHQYFTRAIDFGYSKTAEETMRIWEKDKVLSDMVFVIRKVKPDIIITRFSPEITPGRSTHGHHTASAKLALLAYEYAADATKYPEQLKYYPIHQTKKVFWNTSYWFYGSREKMEQEVAKNPDKYVRIKANTYLPLLGKTCSDISALSRSQHKSQGFGSSPSFNEQLELLELLKGEHQGSTIFDGIPSKWAETSYGKAIGKKVESIESKFDISSPDKSVSDLFELRTILLALKSNVNAVSNVTLAVEKLDRIIAQSIGLKAKALTSERKFFVGEPIEVALDVTAFSSSSTVILNGISVQNLIGESQSFSANLVDSNYQTKWSGKIADDEKHSQPYWLQYDKSLGSYTLPSDPLIVLQGISSYRFNVQLDLTVNGVNFNYKIPILYGRTDPVKGQITQPIIITPDVMLNLDQEVYIFAGNTSKKVTVELISGKSNLKGNVELNLPSGWKSTPMFYKTTTAFKGEKQLFEFDVTPPENQESSVVRAMFKATGKVYTMGLNEILYDHVPNTAWFPTSESTLQKIALEKKGDKIGYIMGAGDKVPEALKEMGYVVELITTEDVLLKQLNYDAVVIGIRAFNTIEDIGNIHEKLMKFIEDGGNLIVQYNTAHRLKSKDFGPYSVALSRKRVTQEDAEVTILMPDHQVVNSPNALNSADFENWVQERGLYFPEEWDENYDAILSMHDSEEDALSGSLLVAQYGKGYFVYTGISFFRELPAGVPGAYRLMANIISLGN